MKQKRTTRHEKITTKKKEIELLERIINSSPGKARVLISAGVLVEHIKNLSPMPYLWGKFPPQTILAKELTARLLTAAINPSRTVYSTAFGPYEILNAMGVNSLMWEAYAVIAAGLGLSNYFLETAEINGIPRTLCSYHRASLGVMLSGISPRPAAFVTPSIPCDGNAIVPQFIKEMLGIPVFVIDVPAEEGPAEIKYLASQLQNMVDFVEKTTGKKFSLSKLQKTIEMENRTVELYREYRKLRKEKIPPVPPSSRLITFFQTLTLFAGTKTSYIFYRNALKFRNKHIPLKEGKKKLIWMHFIPHYPTHIDEILESYNLEVVFEEINNVWWETLDPQKPFESLARKMIKNYFNRRPKERARIINQLVEEFEADGVIHFAPWGCKQTSGAITVVERHLKAPFLNLDGDCIDVGSYTPGQTRTRLESFAESLSAKRS